MTANSIARHCRELDRCNQRGGRMLSVADLVEANTMPLSLAAAVTARIAEGASFMVGANPGGAGKTTVMCALLNFIPPDTELLPATPSNLRTATATSSLNRCCWLCHEISDGPYYGYLWGATLRDYCALSAQGHLLATNLHADTLDECAAQVCGVNRVPEAHFRRFAVLLFLRVVGARRTVHQVYVSNTDAPHELAYDAASGFFEPALLATPARRQTCRTFLETFMAQPERTIEAMRRAVVHSGLFPDTNGDEANT